MSGTEEAHKREVLKRIPLQGCDLLKPMSKLGAILSSQGRHTSVSRTSQLLSVSPYSRMGAVVKQCSVYGAQTNGLQAQKVANKKGFHCRRTLKLNTQEPKLVTPVHPYDACRDRRTAPCRLLRGPREILQQVGCTWDCKLGSASPDWGFLRFSGFQSLHPETNKP